MSLLAEIESAVEQLSLPEQQALLQKLDESVRRRSEVVELTAREAWMARLDQLRASIGSPAPRLDSDAIFDDLRSE